MKHAESAPIVNQVWPFHSDPESATLAISSQPNHPSRKSLPPHLTPYYDDFTALAQQLIDLVGLRNATVTTLEREVLSAFVFGMACIEGGLRRLGPYELHHLIILMYESVFCYTPEEAYAKADLYLAIASGDSREHPTVHEIIRHGLAGHAQWHNGDTPRLQANLDAVFQLLGIFLPTLSSSEVAAWDDTARYWE